MCRSIHDPVPLAARVSAASSATRIVLAEQERTTTLRNAIDEAIRAAGDEMPALEIAIGPEGGWAPKEEALFDANGWRAVSLGPRILRAETAAIAALAVVASCLGVNARRIAHLSNRRIQHAHPRELVENACRNLLALRSVTDARSAAAVLRALRRQDRR